jgi:hypothetical protein
MHDDPSNVIFHKKKEKQMISPIALAVAVGFANAQITYVALYNSLYDKVRLFRIATFHL